MFDLLMRTLLLLDGTAASTVRQLIWNWKAELVEAISGQAVFLGIALANWAQANASPDLNADPIFELDPDDATAVISFEQHRALLEALGHIQPRGITPARVVAEAGKVLVTIGDAKIELPESGTLAARTGSRAVVDATALEDAWYRGRADALAIISYVVNIGWRLFDERRRVLSSDTAREIEARLHTLDKRLRGLAQSVVHRSSPPHPNQPADAPRRKRL